ncbi:Gfo/Idh/MocA family oxidoreductase [Amycolatopsis sp. NPDC005232]|uniref:Gfo/Idh/MocA family protein n=1 Tax=Amycolatopsis sp. NPDC005232 TaxID=3157027 RepID=UPI0033B1C5D6
MNQIGVGIIGGGTTGWAAISHVPALAALRGFALRAVSTSRRVSADAAAEAFGVKGYDNHDDLIADPDVDIVVVAVKVAHHRELTTAVVAAGKTVFTEWPLAIDLENAEELTLIAAAKGVRTIAGLQGRFAPEVRYARDLIADGYVGDILGTTLVGSGAAWGPTATKANSYWYDDKKGVTTFTVPTMHALDAVNHVVGDFAGITADLVRRRDQVTVADDGSILTVTAPDHVAISGVLTSGAAASIYYRGGVSRGDNLRWEINGTAGDLVLTSSTGNFQVADLTLSGGRGDDITVQPLTVPDAYYSDVPRDLSGPAHNVAQLYAQHARDLAENTSLVPDFRHALHRHRFIDAVNRAASTGVRQLIPAAGVTP